MLGTPVVVVFFNKPVASPDRAVPFNSFALTMPDPENVIELPVGTVSDPGSTIAASRESTGVVPPEESI